MIVKLPKLLQKFEKESVVQKLKLKRLFYLECIIMALLLVVLPFVYMFLPVLLTASFLAIANGLAIIMLIKGNLKLSETFHFIAMAAAYTGLLLIATDQKYDIAFFTIIGTIFLLDILLTTSSSWRLYFMVALIVAVPVLSKFMNLSDPIRFGDNLDLAEAMMMTISELITFEIMAVGVGLITIIQYKDSKNLLSMMLREAESSEQRYRKVRELLEQSQGSMQIGNTLEKTSNETMTAVNDMRSDISEVQEGIFSLSRTVKNYSLNSEAARGVAEKLDASNQDQSSAITQSASTIEEMSASIVNISRVSESKKSNIENLVNLADNSRGMMLSLIHI